MFIICNRDDNKTSEASFSILGLIPSIPVDLLGSRDFRMVLSSSDFISEMLNSTFSGFLELINRFSISAFESLNCFLSFISLSHTVAKK